MREFVSSKGLVILVGENAGNNDHLVKSSHQDHLWCHLDNMSSPHAVIKSAEPDKDSISEALQLVKHFSKAKGSQQATMIMCKIRQITRDRKHLGMVHLKQKPTKKSIRNDVNILAHFGLTL